MLEQAGSPTQVREKGQVGNLLTEVDLAAEDAIRAVLEEGSPGVPILAEEGGGAWTEKTRWLVDPLDGTTNFVHGFPFYCSSVALQLDGVLVAGAIYDPIRHECWTAGRGQGAFRDGAPVRVSSTARLTDGLLATGFPYDRREKAAYYTRFVEEFLRVAQGIRRGGSAAMDLVLVASGRLDGYWELGLAPWDVAAGVLLVEEAGGRVSSPMLDALDLDHPQILASNGLIHEQMAVVLRKLLSSE